MMKKFVILLAVISSVEMNAQVTTLIGNAPGLALSEISIYTYTDYITYNTTRLASFTTDTTGYFKVDLNISHITYIFINLGAVKASMYAEPNKTYQIILPQYKSITVADELNPYFETEEIYIGIQPKDTNSLNFNIRKFDFLYNDFLQKEFLKMILLSRKSIVDTAINNIEKLFINNSDTFFFQFRQYKYALLRFIAYQRDIKFVTYHYLANKPVLFYNPAYMDFFNKVYENYFSVYISSAEGASLFQDINLARCPSCISKTLSNNLSLSNDTLRYLVMLKGLHDAFYKGEFNKNNLIQIIDSLIINKNYKPFGNLPREIKIKTTKLLQGTPMPDIDLYDINGNTVKLDQYKNKFIYLNFCHSKSYACNLDYEGLNRLVKNFNEHIQVISVCLDSDYLKLSEYFKANNYSWPLLIPKNPAKVKSDFNIKTYPTYYLINANGLLELSPSPGPNENFDFHLFNVIRKTANN